MGACQLNDVDNCIRCKRLESQFGTCILESNGSISAVGCRLSVVGCRLSVVGCHCIRIKAISNELGERLDLMKMESTI